MERRDSTMGGWVSRAWWGGDPDTPDAMSGLSRRDIYHVRRSWDAIYANPVPNGTELLKRYFREYPEAKKYFRLLDNLEEDDYHKNASFKAHVVSLMGALNSAVQSLHDPELNGALMKKLGDSHRRRKIQKHNFNDLKETLVKLLVEVMNVDDATLESWGRTVDFWYKNIFTQIEAPDQTPDDKRKER